VRNLRIREDTAKYLLNLDTNSAHYDPKSRSMREDPNPNKVRGTGPWLLTQELQSETAMVCGEKACCGLVGSLAPGLTAAASKAVCKLRRHGVV
jgi:hypothetical protein